MAKLANIYSSPNKYLSIQVNVVASLVNLQSLENDNKVKIVRSGIVPPLIEVLFSLPLDDQNKTAIGVLGALPLLHALRAGSDRCRHNSALALYHLSLAQSNRACEEAGAEELLVKKEEMGTDRCKEKAKKILEVMRQKHEEEETVD
ncbi:U-box domain-containing protein 40 [Tanacetum coccineum]